MKFHTIYKKENHTCMWWREKISEIHCENFFKVTKCTYMLHTIYTYTRVYAYHIHVYNKYLNIWQMNRYSAWYSAPYTNVYYALKNNTLYLKNVTKSFCHFIQLARHHDKNICLFHFIQCHNLICNLQGEFTVTCWLLLASITKLIRTLANFCYVWYLLFHRAVKTLLMSVLFLCMNHGMLKVSDKATAREVVNTNSRTGLICILSWIPSWKW